MNAMFMIIGVVVKGIGVIRIIHLCGIGISIIIVNCYSFLIMFYSSSFLRELESEMKLAMLKTTFEVLSFEYFEKHPLFFLTRPPYQRSLRPLNSNIFLMSSLVSRLKIVIQLNCCIVYYLFICMK